MGRYDERGGGNQLIYGIGPKGNEIPLSVKADGTLKADIGDLLLCILIELKIMNMHLALMSGDQIGEEDVKRQL